MTIVVIGGTQHAPLAGLEAYLRQHGMAQALPSEAGEVRTVNDWVDRYFASGVPMAQNDAAHPPPAKRSWLARMFGKAAPPPLALHAVSTPWLLSISNLVIANATQPVWGWANRRNGHLLELWLDLDPAIHFVGLITCPAHELALAQESSEAPIDAAGVLAVWRQTTEKLLAAQRQHPGRLHLVESRALNESTAAALLQSLSLSAAEEQHTPLAQALPAPDPLLASTFAQALKADAATQAVWQRVRLQLQLPAEAEHEGTEALAQAVIKLREELKSARHTSEAEAKAKQAALAERNAEAQAKQAALAERDAQAKLAQERAAAIASLQKEHSDLKAARDAEAQAKQAALAARDAEAQAKQGVTAERDALQQQLQTEKAKLTEQTEESELLLLQLHQVQEELEQYFLQAQDLKQEKEQLEQRVSRLLAR
ncbi:MAG: hypothetical protein RL434_2126, partial [Pseudomonadota bacterium]